MTDDDVFYRISTIMNVDPAEIAKIVHDYIERDIGCDYDRLNCPKPPIYIGPVKVKSLKEKIDNYKRRKKEMKATSVQKIENVNNICFSIENHPAEMESKLVIVASTNDDIFAFEFKGPELLQICKGAGLFTGWEKDQKIRELEKRNKQNKELANAWAKEYYYLSKKFDKLQEEYKSLEDRKCHFLLHGMYFTPDELLNRILELEKVKTPTIENFADEEPTDNVNHPSHYTGKYECIDVMQDVFGDEATNDFCLCNAFKYIWRARKKNGLEDVKKAVWYLNKYIEEAEKDGEDEVTRT